MNIIIIKMVKGKFIVIEGLDATGKTTIVPMLSASIDAMTLNCPPKLLDNKIIDLGLDHTSDLRKHFDKQPSIVRRAYYRAANLIASEQAKKTIETGKHVVMDRYWTSTIAFSVLDKEGPITNIEYGTYPPEMLKPDIMIFLTVDEKHRSERLRGRGEVFTEEETLIEKEIEKRENVLNIYRKYERVEVDTSMLTPKEVRDKIILILKQNKII